MEYSNIYFEKSINGKMIDSGNINLKYDGDELEIGFNSKYIMDVVNNLEDEIITLNLKDGSSPITAQEKSNPNLIYVLMPMRV